MILCYSSIITRSPYSQISYEDFRQHMKGIYDEYERSQLPQVSSTDEQRSHPISTVSGIADKVRQTTRMDSSGEPGPCNISIKQIESLDEVIPSPGFYTASISFELHYVTVILCIF